MTRVTHWLLSTPVVVTLMLVALLVAPPFAKEAEACEEDPTLAGISPGVEWGRGPVLAVDLPWIVWSRYEAPDDPANLDHGVDGVVSRSSGLGGIDHLHLRGA